MAAEDLGDEVVSTVMAAALLAVIQAVAEPEEVAMVEVGVAARMVVATDVTAVRTAKHQHHGEC